MKNCLYLLTFLFLTTSAYGQHDHSDKPATDTLKKSIPKEIHQSIGKAHVMIYYHAPAVRGRTIWGGLVPYDDVWVTGAHAATTLEIDAPFKIGDKEIPAGKYALFTIPGKEKWIFILNKNWEQHLADEYDAKEDVIRLEVLPVSANHQERLAYSIDQTGERSFNLIIRWEKILLRVAVTIRD